MTNTYKPYSLSQMMADSKLPVQIQNRIAHLVEMGTVRLGGRVSRIS